MTNTNQDSRDCFAGSLFRSVYDRLELDDASAQRLNKRDVELQDGIAKLLMALSASYVDEEFDLNQFSGTYSKEYMNMGPKPITEQIEILAKTFNLDPSHALEFTKNLPQIPTGAEGWFAIPTVDALVEKQFPEVNDAAVKYCLAVDIIIREIAISRSFESNITDLITPAHLRVHVHTVRALNIITKKQKGGILIIAGQLGMLHRGRSPSRARELFVNNEFGMTSLAVGSIILTNPKIFSCVRDMNILCPGDEFAHRYVGDDNPFPYLPQCTHFTSLIKEVLFGAYRMSGVLNGEGSATGFF